MRVPTSQPLGATRGVDRLRALALLPAAGLLVAALVLAGSSRNATSGLILAAAFGVLAVAVWGPASRAATGVAVLFVVYGGISAAIAAQKAASKAPGVAGDGSYRYALTITAFSGFAATAAAWLATRKLRRTRREVELEVDPRLTERAGKILVGIGFAGLAAAAARFALTAPASHSLWDSLKSFWMGGSYFLLLAGFAVPGFGLWLNGALLRGSRFHDLRLLSPLLVLYAAASVPTGQRGFLVQIALMLAAVVLYRRRPSARTVLALGLIGVVALGVTQAVRNDARETGTVTVSQIVSRMAPARWGDLYGSQLASFRWTWDVAQRRGQLNIPNTFVSALFKPVPRQLYPKKVQGFGEEFTKRLYPAAYAEHVSFATPLVAEADYSFGAAGAIVFLSMLGLLAGVTESRATGSAPGPLKPIIAAALVWCIFVFIRGDFANALVVGAGWVLPLVAVSACVGFWPRRLGGRALAVRLQQRRIRRAEHGVAP